MSKKPLSFLAGLFGSIAFFCLVTILGVGLMVSNVLGNFLTQDEDEE